MKQILKHKKYLCFVLMFLLFLVYHLIIKMGVGDDAYFETIWNNEKIINWSINRYYTWNSRQFIDIIVVFMSAHRWLFTLINISLWVTLPYQLSKLIGKKRRYMCEGGGNIFYLIISIFRYEVSRFNCNFS